jgi:hypothetical protein
MRETSLDAIGRALPNLIAGLGVDINILWRLFQDHVIEERLPSRVNNRFL